MLNIGVHELEAEIANKKKAIASIKDKLSLNFDKFTKQDEILLEILNETERTNNLLLLTNRILFLSLKNQLGGEIPIIEGLEEISGTRYQSRVFRVDGVKDEGRIFTLDGSGVISEVELISSNLSENNKTYSVRIVGDDDILYNDTWDGFSARTMHEADMTAFNDTNNNKYVLLFQDICYDESFYLELYANSAEFDYINVKYHKKIGVF